jgi:predicted double-glycine peptidase
VLHEVKELTLAAAPLAAADLDTTVQQGNASRALVRISQLDPAQYNSQADFATWAYSACSTAAMTEVFNAYGRHYRIADVLKVESALGEITPQQGLLENVGVAHTAAQFGFQTNWGNSWTLDQVINTANAGYPVIVGWPPSLYPEGHIVVVIGGDAQTVRLADSSLWDRQAISRSQFLQWWGGFAAVVTPA